MSRQTKPHLLEGLYHTLKLLENGSLITTDRGLRKRLERRIKELEARGVRVPKATFNSRIYS